MTEAPRPQGIVERYNAFRSLVHQGMLNHRDDYFQKLWGADLPKQEGDPDTVLPITRSAVAEGVALALSSRTRTELKNETRKFIKQKEKEIKRRKLMNEPEKGPLIQGLLTSLQAEINAPGSRIHPEKAGIDFRTKIAQQVAQLALVTNVEFTHTIRLVEIGEDDEIIYKEKSFKELGLSYAERLWFLGPLTEVAINATLRQLQKDRAVQ